MYAQYQPSPYAQAGVQYQSPHVVQSPSAPRVVQGMPPVHNAQPAHYAQPAQYTHPAQYTSAVPVSRPYAVAAQPISPQMPYGAPPLRLAILDFFKLEHFEKVVRCFWPFQPIKGM